MIQSKDDLIEYLLKDKEALGRKYKRPHFGRDEIWRFQIALRKHEYYANTKKNKFLEKYWAWQHHRLAIKLGFTIPINVFGPGLNIHHHGYIVVNAHAKVGANCNIQQGVNIGQNYGSDNCPIIGDNVYLGPGCKLFGNIQIANDIAVGANSVVTHSFLKEGVTIAGVPAKVIGERKSGLV